VARGELVGLAHVDEVPALAIGRAQAPQRFLGRDHFDVSSASPTKSASASGGRAEVTLGILPVV
jgi:hypothetical protein